MVPCFFFKCQIKVWARSGHGHVQKGQQKLGRYGNVRESKHGNVQKLGKDVNLGKPSMEAY